MIFGICLKMIIIIIKRKNNLSKIQHYGLIRKLKIKVCLLHKEEGEIFNFKFIIKFKNELSTYL